MKKSKTYELKVIGADKITFAKLLACVIKIKGWNYNLQWHEVPSITEGPVYGFIHTLLFVIGGLNRTLLTEKMKETIHCIDDYLETVKNAYWKDINISDLKFNKQSHALTFRLKVPDEIKETFIPLFWELFIVSIQNPS